MPPPLPLVSEGCMLLLLTGGRKRAKIVKLPLASEGCIYIRADGQRKMQLLQLLRLAKKHKVAMALAEKLWRFSQL
jgi:hypothetical protein